MTTDDTLAAARQEMREARDALDRERQLLAEIRTDLTMQERRVSGAMRQLDTAVRILEDAESDHANQPTRDPAPCI